MAVEARHVDGDDGDDDDTTALLRRIGQLERQLAARDTSIEALSAQRASLEVVCAQRTAELAATQARAQRVHLMLDHVAEGLAIVDASGAIHAECSASFERLGDVGDTPHIAEWIAGLDVAAGAWVQMAWPDLFTDVLPFEVVAGQLPTKLIAADGRTFELALHPVREAEQVVRVLVVVTDVTARVSHEREEREVRDALAVIEIAARDRAYFAESSREVGLLLVAVADESAPRDVRLRALHTCKGIARTSGVQSFAIACHEIEDVLAADTDPTAARALLASLNESLARLATRLGPIIADPDVIEIRRGAWLSLVDDGLRLQRDELVDRIARLTDEPVRRHLERLRDQGAELATALGKRVEIVVDADDVCLPPLPDVWASFIHVIRNAIDHGVDTVEARMRAGKTGPARITLRARDNNEVVVVEVGDDGAGVDWGRVAARAAQQGLHHETPNALRDALFADGLTTRDRVTEISGRGVGLAAVRAAVLGVGGAIEVSSEKGVGTSFLFALPHRRLSSTKGAQVSPSRADGVGVSQALTEISNG